MDFRRSQKPPERPLQAPQQRNVTNIGAPSISHSVSERSRSIPRYGITAFVMAVILMIGLVGWCLMTQPAGPKGDRYQVVFLDDNQVFFGKLKNTHGDYLRLENVYSTQSDSSSTNENAQSVSNDVALVKVGNLVYGPEDTMMIRADKVKFWQDLKSDSKISKTIDSQQ